MTVRTRFGAFAIVGCILVGASTVLAQTETPSGGPDKSAQTEPPSTWTDPPVRGAAGPKASDTSPESGKPTENAAAPDKAEPTLGKPTLGKPTPGKPTERAAGPEKPAPVADRTQAARRSAKLRREQIRVAARSPSSAQGPRYGRVARLHDTDTSRWRRHLTERRSYAYRAYRSRPARDTTRFAMRDERNDAAYGYGAPYRSRRAGWGGLIGGAPEDRFTQARAAGYIVMRARSYAYPDGTRVRELTPYEPDGF